MTKAPIIPAPLVMMNGRMVADYSTKINSTPLLIDTAMDLCTEGGKRVCSIKTIAGSFTVSRDEVSDIFIKEFQEYGGWIYSFDYAFCVLPEEK